MNIQLKTLFKHRSVWMGIAILLVVLYHYEPIYPDVSVPVLKIIAKIITKIKNTAYGGTDIFMFASGLGAYFSYTKDHDATAFLIRRFKRLAPVYFPFIVIWSLYKYFHGNFPIKAAIGNLFALQEFSGLGNAFNWYIAALLIVYILTPFFAGLIKKINNARDFFLLIALLWVISVPFWGSTNGIIIVTRLPIFVIGMYFAKLSENDEIRLQGKFAIILAVTMFAGMLLLMLFLRKLDSYCWNFGLFWYPFILITPGLCIFTSAFAEMVWKIKFFRILFNILDKIGKYSFEIFLVHLLCLDIYQNDLIPAQILPESKWSLLILWFSVIPMCLLLHICSKGCIKLAKHSRHIFDQNIVREH